MIAEAFIILLQISFVLLQYINLPFKKYYSQSIVENIDLTNNIGVEICLGTPPQCFIVNIEFYTESLYVYNKNCEDNTHEAPSFEKQQSSTYQMDNQMTIGFNYRRYIQGSYAYDAMTIGEKTIPEVRAYYTNRMSKIRVNSGVLGFDVVNRVFDRSNFMGFTEQLLNKKLLKYNIFTIMYKNDNSGMLILGDYPHLIKEIDMDTSMNHYKLSIAKTQRDGYVWGLEYNSIIFDWNGDQFSQMNPLIKYQIEFNTTIGSSSFLSFVNQNFFADNVQKNLCWREDISSAKYFTYVCKQEVDTRTIGALVFNLKGEIITIEPHELFNEDGFSKKTFSIIFSEFVKENEEWIVGELFFQKKIWTFDMTNKMIGFYTKNNLTKTLLTNQNSKGSIISIVFFVIGIVVLGILFTMKILAYRKRRLIMNNSPQIDYDLLKMIK